MRILWIPHASWHVPQREHHLLRALGLKHQVFATDWDTDFHRLTDYASGRYIKNFIPAYFQDGDITVYHVPRVSPALYVPAIRRYNERLYQRSLARLVKRHHIDWIIGSFVVPYLDVGVPVSIDICDDHVAYWHERGATPNYAHEIEVNENSWLNVSQHITVVSSVLRERLRPRIPHQTPVTVISNGVDLDTFVPAVDKAAVKTALGLNPGHRHIACIGSFNRSAEIERLLAVARRIQTEHLVSLIIVGHGTMIPRLRSTIQRERLNRVIVAGFHRGHRLLQYFQACDVGLCPYSITPALQASSPLRLLQYSAVGATVVIPAFDEVLNMRFSNVCFSQDSHEDFARVTMEALDVVSDVPSAIDAYDWRRLADRMTSTMKLRENATAPGMIGREESVQISH